MTSKATLGRVLFFLRISFEVKYINISIISDTINQLKALSASHPGFSDRCHRISGRLAESVFFFSEIFPELEKVFEPVINFIKNMGVEQPSSNRINGKSKPRESSVQLTSSLS